MSRFLNTARLEMGGLTLGALNTGGTQSATEVDGLAVSVAYTGLRFRHVQAVVAVDQPSGTAAKWGFTGNLQSRIATSGTGSTYADFGATMNRKDRDIAGASSGSAQYVYQSPYEEVPAKAVQVRLQYTPKGFTGTSGAEAFSSATGGIADVTPLLLLTDPNRLPADGATA